MIPATSQIVATPIEAEEQTSFTWRMNKDALTIEGFCDGQEAMAQAVYRCMNVERFRHTIYTSSYGVNLERLVGKPRGYAFPEIKRETSEALHWDTRVVGVGDFTFQNIGLRQVMVRFAVSSIFGLSPVEMAVPV